MGELAAAAAAAEEEKCFGSFYIFFWRGRFGTAAESAAGFYLALFLFLSRSGEFEEERKERRQSKVFPNDLLSASEGEKKREGRRGEETRTCGEVGRKSIGFFVFIYFYVLYTYIYYLVVFSCCVDREKRERNRRGEGRGGEGDG